MGFCVNCGKENEQNTSYCVQCGSPLKVTKETTTKIAAKEERLHASSESTNKKATVAKKPLSKRNKILLSIAVVLVLCVGVVYAILDNKYDPMNRVKDMHTAYTNGDIDAFYQQFSIPKGTEANAETFMSLVKEIGWKELRTQLVDEINKLNSGKGQDAIQYTYGDFIVIKDKPVLLGLFHDVEFSVVPLEVDVYSPLEGMALTIGGKTITTDIADDFVPVGNFLPGEYTYSYTYDKGYVPLEGEGTVYIDSYDSPQTTIELDIYLSEVDLYSELEDAILYVNGKSTEKTIEEIETLSPVVFNEDVEVYAVAKDAEGNDVKSDVYNLTSSDIYFEYDYLRQQEELEETISEVDNFYQNYRYDYQDAIYYADFYYVEDYFEEGSQIQKDYQKFVEDHADIEEYSYTFLLNDVKSITPLSDTEFELLSTEEFNYWSPTDGTINYVREKRYVIEQKEDQFYIKNIEDLSTKKNKID